MPAPLASWKHGLAAGSGRWREGEGLALAFGFCPMTCSLPGSLQQPWRRQGTLANTVHTVPIRLLAGPSEGRQKARSWPSSRARPPQLTHRATACAEPHVGGVCGCAKVCVWQGEGALRAAPSVRFIRDTLIYNQIHLIKILLKGIISLQRSSTCFKQHDKL